MSDIYKLTNERIVANLSGGNSIEGLLTHIGQDVIVIYDGDKRNYYYIPFIHVHTIARSKKIDEIKMVERATLVEEMEAISYRKVLMNAKGTFAEIYVTSNLTFHGYITNVLSDYFVFYSPVFKNMYISLSHLKWITPYNHTISPYTLTNELLPVTPINIPVLRYFEEQLKREVGKLVVFDGGQDPKKIGLLKHVDKSVIQIAIASGEEIFSKMNHVKSVHFP